MLGLALIGLSGLMQDPRDLDSALALAESENKLVAVVLAHKEGEDAGFGSVVAKSLATSPTVLARVELEKGTLVWRGMDLPRLPMVCFLDKSGDVVGQVVGPVGSELMGRWTAAVTNAWKRHDSLVFRAKGRLSEKDTAVLAFSYASRLNVTKASSLAAQADPRRLTPEQELTTFALGQAHWSRGRKDRAAESFGTLRGNRTSRDLRVLARLNYAELVEPTRHDEAVREVREVLATVDLAEQERWLATSLLTRFSESSTR